MSGEAEARSEPRPARPPAGAHRRDQGDRQAVRGRALQRPAARRSTKVDASSPAILEAWFGGVEAGNAVADVALRQGQPGRQAAGRASRAASARCRSTTTTSRRAARATSTRSTTRATATSVSCAPLYEFGYGLSYTTFKVDNLRFSSHDDVRARGAITASVDVTNTGTRRRRRRRPALHPRPGREHLAAGAPPARLPARDARARPDATVTLDARRRRTSASTTTRAGSASRPGRSRSTPATARPRRTTARRSG